MTSKYQLVFILEDNDEAKLKKIESTIKDHDGDIKQKETWGKKTFSYLINKKIAGYYFDWVISLPGNKAGELKNLFNLNHDLVRYLFIKSN